MGNAFAGFCQISVNLRIDGNFTVVLTFIARGLNKKIATQLRQTFLKRFQDYRQ